MFTLLYNHIKAKMLPSSFLIKNRLHVERDSKFRRIVSSFGTTFRNSKWSDYSIKNVNNQPKKWISLVFKYLTIILIVMSIDFLLHSNMFLHTLSPYLVFLTDHYDMGTTLKILVTEAIPVAINEAIKFVISVIFSNGPSFVYIFSEQLLRRLIYKPDTLTPKLNYNKPVINAFITKPLTPFNPNLFKSFYLVANMNVFDLRPNLSSNLVNNILPTRPSFWDENIDTGLTVIDLSNRNSIITKSWDLENIFDEVTYNKYNGNFYLKTLKYSDLNIFNLNTELRFVTNSISNQTDTLKLVRWLYKYNVLHRKTLKQSHNLTLSKKLISSGFFDSKIMTNNLWFSDTYSRLNDSNLLTNTIRSQWNTMYFGSLSRDTSVNKANNNLSMYQNNFRYLNFYESSFSYFTKRAFQFLGLNNNLFSTTIKLCDNIKTPISGFDASANYLGLSNNLNNVTIINNNLNPYNHPFINNLNTNLLDSNREVNYINDVLPIFGEDELLSNDLLQATFNITQSFNKPSQMFSFYDPYYVSRFKSSLKGLELANESDYESDDESDDKSSQEFSFSDPRYLNTFEFSLEDLEVDDESDDELLQANFNIIQSFNEPSQEFSFYDPHYLNSFEFSLEDLEVDDESDDESDDELLQANFNITQSFDKPSRMFSFYDPHHLNSFESSLEDLEFDDESSDELLQVNFNSIQSFNRPYYLSNFESYLIDLELDDESDDKSGDELLQANFSITQSFGKPLRMFSFYDSHHLSSPESSWEDLEFDNESDDESDDELLQANFNITQSFDKPSQMFSPESSKEDLGFDDKSDDKFNSKYFR